MVPLLFFGSGATALVCEVVWFRYLSLLLGNTVQAQTIVLATFLGGLALGSRWFGARAGCWRRPLATYGFLEIGIGLYTFSFDRFYGAADDVFVWFGTGRLDDPHFLLLLKAGLGIALLLAPTILMGGTLPALAASLPNQSPDAGRQTAHLYAVNCFGAVAGAAFAGFFLVHNLGLIRTLDYTALVQAFIGLAALWLGRRPVPTLVPAAAPEAADLQPDNPPAARTNLRAACALVAVTGGVSLGLQLLATRSIVLLVGASIQAFALVLIAFILGIAAGSLVISGWRFRGPPPPEAALGLLGAAALWLGLLVIPADHWVEVYRHARAGFAGNESGYTCHQLLTAGFALIVLGLPAALIGTALPLCIRRLPSERNALPDGVGRLLAWNTLGAVAGVVLTGFVLMPWLGLRTAFLVQVTLLSLAALAVAVASRRRRLVVATGVMTIALPLVARNTDAHWPLTLSSGIFRLHEDRVDSPLLAERQRDIDLLFYEDAADATVSVERLKRPGAGTNHLVLRINGKPDASTALDMATQLLCAHLPLIAHPEAKDVFILGLGSGVTAAAAARHPVDRILVAENCRPVLRAAEHFRPWNGGITTNARVRIVLDDGRTALKLSPQPYDVIINEPSNPWMAGVADIFSQDYYRLCAAKLKPGGIVAHWFHLYETNDDLVQRVIDTFVSVFPHVELWDVNAGDVVLLGSPEPWASGLEAFRRSFERTAVRAQLEELGLPTPEALWARQWASQRTGHALATGKEILSDDRPSLEYAAPKAFFLGNTAARLRRFDERTWQFRQAPAEKQQALAGLDRSSLQSIFRNVPSANPELEDQTLALGRQPAQFPASARTLPSIFARARGFAEPSSTRSNETGGLPRAPAEAAPATHPRSPSLTEADYLARIAARESRASGGGLRRRL